MHVIMQERLAALQRALAAVGRLRRRSIFPGITVLSSILHPRQGLLRDLSLAFPEERTPGATYLDWDAIDRGEQPTFRIHRSIVLKFIEVADQSRIVGPRRDFWHFDLFLVHELLHSFQGMERGRHRGYQSLAPALLASLDYQADAIAVLTTFGLMLLSPADFFGRFSFLPRPRAASPRERATRSLLQLAEQTVANVATIVPYWGTFTRLLHAQLWHLAVFTAAMVDTEKPGNAPNRSLLIASGRVFPLVKLERTFAWYLHYFRSRHFQYGFQVDEMNLLHAPQVEFRNLRAASAVAGSFVVRDWPDREQSFRNESLRPASSTSRLRLRDTLDPATNPQIALTVRQTSGFARILRWTEHSGGDLYSQLFRSLFESNVDASRPFFEDLLRSNPWLLGFADDPIRGIAPPDADVRLVFSPRREKKQDYVTLSDPRTRSAIIKSFASIR